MATEQVSEMSYFYMTAEVARGGAASSPPCATIDDALRGAKFMLGNGAASVWIVDDQSNLVLPADQVRLRLDLPSPAPGGAVVDGVAVGNPQTPLPPPPLPS